MGSQIEKLQRGHRMLDIVFADLANYHKALLEQSLRTHHSQSNLSQSNLAEWNPPNALEGTGSSVGGSAGGQWQQGQWVNQNNQETEVTQQRVGFHSAVSSSSVRGGGSSSSGIADLGSSDTTTPASVTSFATPLKPSRSAREFSLLASTTGSSSSSSSSRVLGQAMNETRITQTQSIGGSKGLGSFVTVGRMSHLKVGNGDEDKNVV